MTIIGKMIDAVTQRAVKIGATLKNGKKTLIKGGATFLAVVMMTGSLTGCTWVELFSQKPEQLPDETDVKIEAPVTEEDLETESPLLSNKVPQMDKNDQAPSLGGGDETEVEIKPQPEPDNSVETDAPETDVDKDNDVKLDLEEAKKVVNTLKTSINASLQNYFKQTGTLTSATYTAQEIVSVKATSENLEVAFTTKTANGKQGYNIVKVGNTNHGAEAMSIIEKNGKDSLFTLSIQDLQSLINNAIDAVNTTGITINGIEEYYVIPLTIDSSVLGEKVIAYYKTLTPGGENCKKNEGGYIYSANILIQNASGETVKSVSASSTAQLGRNQYFEAINGAIKDQLLQDENTADLGL